MACYYLFVLFEFRILEIVRFPRDPQNLEINTVFRDPPEFSYFEVKVEVSAVNFRVSQNQQRKETLVP